MPSRPEFACFTQVYEARAFMKRFEFPWAKEKPCRLEFSRVPVQERRHRSKRRGLSKPSSRQHRRPWAWVHQSALERATPDAWRCPSFRRWVRCPNQPLWKELESWVSERVCPPEYCRGEKMWERGSSGVWGRREFSPCPRRVPRRHEMPQESPFAWSPRQKEGAPRPPEFCSECRARAGSPPWVQMPTAQYER